MKKRNTIAKPTAAVTLYDRVLQLLQRHDPAHLIPDRHREYEPIASAVVQRLATVNSATELREVIYDEAEIWIAIGVGPEDRYDEVARDICAAWQEH